MANLGITQRYPEINLLCLALLIIITGRINITQGNAIECGTVNLYRELILGGSEVLRDEWPFIAALYYSTSLKYFCGGTIISNKHVLTAAHCIQGKFSNVILSPDEITIRLGAYNLTAVNESGVVNRNVTQIHMHPDWSVLEEKYDADIAILVLNENVTFSSNIRPVCLPTDDVNIEEVKGMVVGWGVTENGTAEGIPRQTETMALNDSYCYRTDNVIARYSSERSFCGVGNGTPNKGDSGDGYFVVIGSAWVQYGTVSVVRTNATGHVVVGSFAIYMKITSLKHWIADTVRQSGSSVSEATIKINLHCSYGYDGDGIYGCWLLDLNIRKPNFVVNSVTGSHMLQREDKDVELIAFVGGVMHFLPDNVGNIFKNLKYLGVGKPSSVSIDTERIFRSNFQNLEHLEEIILMNNAIEELDADSLWDLPNLQSFQLKKNKLKLLHASTFSRNSKLTTVFVLSNVLKALPQNLFENNPLLEVVAFDGNSIETIADGIFDTNINLKTVSIKGNRLESLGSNLFPFNSELESIDFSNNALKTIDEQIFKTNSKLIKLAIASNELEYIPPLLLQNKTLMKEINFKKNLLKSIDERLFETNIRISEIYLWSNQLKTLPRNLFHNNLVLEVVDLGKNFIRTIDETLFETNVLLRKISLESNRLNELPRHLFKHNSLLEFLNVRSNFLATVNVNTFESNGRLREVYFEGNYLTFLPTELFKNNLLLRIVDLGNNSLEAIDERLFEVNLNIRQIFLSDNILDTLPTNLFRNNSLLEIVDLSKNFFETIDENIFRTNSRLTKISFEGNQLQSLPRNLFQGNDLLQHIDFRGNSLKVIGIDFTEYKRAFYINLYKNVCVDAVFFNVDGPSTETIRNKFKNLTEFQDLLIANCSYPPINPPSSRIISVE
ncbi:insulin-like growth factor-binding protein complex acid labile subunit [Bradysia coprophila]|uniref:insulin-like growth factor-binding protein complex acid labile subunit n=1 Tax=Bradysia coprophila TaxID=38358 RepID=UPI00187D7074|nr:insulin-like growth factor-binding protein complex acid labile subunit [Bradysia coprophila]